jgi:hypothetical protein
VLDDVYKMLVQMLYLLQFYSIFGSRLDKIKAPVSEGSVFSVHTDLR